jgi:hypothetical protein
MNTEERVEITVTVAAADMYLATLALTWTRMARLFFVLCALAVLLFVVDRGDSSSALDSPAVLVTVIAVLFVPLYSWIHYSRASRVVKDSRAYRSPLNYVFTGKGISVSGPTFQAESDWSNVSQVVETRSAFILNPSVVSITILPKRCFPDSSAIATLRELMRSHVSANMKLLS